MIGFLREPEAVDDRACPGEGRCHGCAVWCDACGDVGVTCDAPVCDRHRCNRCGVWVVSIDDIYDGQAWCPSCVREDP